MFVTSDDREKGGQFIWRDGKQSLTRFPSVLCPDGSGIFTKPSLLSSSSYLPFSQIFSISAYSKFSLRRLRARCYPRDVPHAPGCRAPRSRQSSFSFSTPMGKHGCHPRVIASGERFAKRKRASPSLFALSAYPRSRTSEKGASLAGNLFGLAKGARSEADSSGAIKEPGRAKSEKRSATSTIARSAFGG